MLKIFRALGMAVLLTVLLAYPASNVLAQQNTLLTFSSGEKIAYAPYELYLDVTDEIARYSARQGIIFTLAMESYLSANNVVVGMDEFYNLCGEEMNEYLQSETFALISGILQQHYDLTSEEIVQCVLENYWSQYIARMMSGLFNALSEMSDESSESMFHAFTEQFYENFSLEEDDSVALFAGETIHWTDIYENLCTYSSVVARVEKADAIAVNRSVEIYLEENGISTDLSGLDESVEQAVASMKSNELYSRTFDKALAKKGHSMDEFLEAMTPFVIANFQRASFGAYCYELYAARELQTDAADSSTAMEDFYNAMLDSVSQPYTVNYLGW